MYQLSGYYNSDKWHYIIENSKKDFIVIENYSDKKYNTSGNKTKIVYHNKAPN